MPTKMLVSYDSGQVAAGAVINSPVFDLSECASLEILADNTAGSAFRDLTMSMYLSDGTTLIETLLLRKVYWGLAANGAQYDPGRARGYVGPNPPGGTGAPLVLYDVTSAANAPLTTGALIAEDADSLYAVAIASSGTTQLQFTDLDDVGGASYPSGNSTAAGQYNRIDVGAGSVGGAAGMNSVAFSFGVPRRCRFDTTAAGLGNTVRLLVRARGRVPGTFAHQMVLPPRAKFTLAAAGAANGRLTVIGH